MATRRLTRWQKAGALVPMALLVTAWGAALSTSGLANADDADAGAVPDVPATAFGDPASTEALPGIDARGGAANAVSTLSPNGIPSAALYAYRRAETLLAKADESCQLPWHLLAAIGRVESNHGRTQGNALDADGLAKPGIYGLPLDGREGRARITDTDGGKLDKDTELDRAVGPMQFIPGTWKSVGVDADGDDQKNPQDVDDAATAAGVYLCAGPGDMSKDSDARAAVGRYNRSSSYVDLVMEISERYRTGEFTETPDGYSTSPSYTNRSADQTLTEQERKKSAKKEKESSTKPKPGDPGTTPGGGGGIIPGTGGGGGTGGGSGSGSGVTGLIDAIGSDLGGGGSSGGGSTGGGGSAGGGGGSATLTWAEARLKCIADGVSVLNVPALTKCITDLLQ